MHLSVGNLYLKVLRTVTYMRIFRFHSKKHVSGYIWASEVHIQDLWTWKGHTTISPQQKQGFWFSMVVKASKQNLTVLHQNTSGQRSKSSINLVLILKPEFLKKIIADIFASHLRWTTTL